ncbi:MAG: hypothetical protein A3G41_05895 [Elusimicrobia bacterium RIFCSPLOWO2_12_FULL_59_9]|nr:MAG: hypothetical protein A3G41_05895 [Elusimicrobia bacterium RIFCSPLOWO2_12_FULL_59_9]
MAIQIRFTTVILKKAAIESTYPGGLAWFLRSYPKAARDDRLVGVVFMSSGDVQRFIDVLNAMGFDLANGFAVGDMYVGVLESCEGIEFTPVGKRRFDGWLAW